MSLTGGRCVLEGSVVRTSTEIWGPISPEFRMAHSERIAIRESTISRACRPSGVGAKTPASDTMIENSSGISIGCAWSFEQATTAAKAAASISKT